MSRAIDLMNKISEIGYYGQYNDYSEQPYDQDHAEYMKPFADVQLPDKNDGQNGMYNQQLGTDRRKSRTEDGIPSPNQ